MALAALPFAVAPASAYVPCPDYDIEVGEINNWDTLWPTEGADPKGVTLCHATGTLFSKGYLQIVDLDDGAKIRIHSELDAEGPWTDPFQSHATFKKRTADEWYDFIRSSTPNSNTPPTARLFSTTNASFFKDDNNDNPTKLPFPHKYEFALTLGVAVREQDGPDYNAPKRYFKVDGPHDGWDQEGDVGVFPTPYGWSASTTTLFGGIDATVGFDPLYPIGEESRRNYVGQYEDKIYIFTSDTEYTNEQAYAIMQAIQPQMEVIQLDGGGSAQFHSDYGWMDSNIPAIPFGDRKVPDVIAIYRAP